ncbi:hypothetical protein PHMEG_00040979 [Phytophthora megakarya]|uniref:Uncharacterized protein n=1 Tax=Phytophthora megakarya TaxID=4795 RepID=A0A225UCV8_9STRA|nr:hypothetical protein PHMEG_00040979 [Phytophthora megakarya]
MGETKTNAPIPDIRDESHAIDLFNMGYQTLRLKPSKRKRRANQIKLKTVLRLPRVNALERCRSNIASGRSHHQATPFPKP